MKRICVLLALAFTLNLQGQTYYPFPDTNSIWHTVGYNMFDWNEYVFNFALDGDTLINGQEFSKVYQLADTSFADPGSTYIGALRENQDHQVLLLLPGIPEFVLYDFNLNAGDTIWYPVGGALCGSGYTLELREHFKIVNSIQTILLSNGETRKSWRLDFMNDTWVEGIGSITWFGLLNPLISDVALCGDQYFFGCFKHLNEVVFIDETVCNPCLSAYILSTPELQVSKDFTVTYDAASRQLIIDPNTIKSERYQFQLLDLTGQEIAHQSARYQQTIKIPKTNLTTGLYIYQITTSTGHLQSGKIYLP